ncbi:MAG: PAS domain S-box protein [Candidatus Rokubacteria bacterium]|nr:PAS domain S-box protein [Candidatus Rokubacteria bacterium]
MAVLEVPNLSAALRGLSVARLLAAGLLLGIGALISLWGGLLQPFLPLALCFAGAGTASAIYLFLQPAAGHLRRFAWLQLILDSAVVTAIVAFSGGPRSIFTFLYVLVVTAASVVLARPGGLVIAALSSLLYTALVLSRTPLSQLVEPTETIALEVMTIFLNTAAFLVVGILAGSLGERYHVMHRTLSDQSKNLSDLQAFKDLMFESLGSGLVGMDLERRITALNRAAEEITGHHAAEAVGCRWESVFGDGIPPEEIDLATGMEGWQVRRYEIRLRRKDGRDVPLGISFWPLRSGRGELAGIIGVFQDLSSIKQLEERMRQADRLATVGRLAANIAHEIRNPLASLSGAIEVLTRELPSGGSHDRLVEIVLRESDRLNQIVKEFLEYARPAPLHPIRINVGEVLDEVLLLLEHRALPPDLKIAREYDGAGTALVDPQQFRQAIWNLCLNALEAMPAGGELRIGAGMVTERKTRKLEIWVADTGTGIDPESLPHVFEPFFSTKPEGSGIGLALVHRVIQDHGGDIEVRSEPGVGTTFTLRLPLAESTRDA